MIFVSTKKQCRFNTGRKTFLEERERLVEQGKAQFVDWETAKKRIAKRIT